MLPAILVTLRNACADLGLDDVAARCEMDSTETDNGSVGIRVLSDELNKACKAWIETALAVLAEAEVDEVLATGRGAGQAERLERAA